MKPIAKFALQLSLFVFLISGCTFKEQGAKDSVKKVNGMSFSSMTLDNQLEVLLVSDSRFKKSSAAMAVMVGSLEDPSTSEGLAHYLEHMLFLGTKEFPKHDEYSTYIENNGGWDNAYTSDEVTNYMFEVDHAAIEGGLQRFSRFFVSPSFDAQFLDREKNAVNSEFEKNIKVDGWRMDRYISQLSKKDHPNGKFSTGNTKTLAAVDRPTVINFYRKYYSSNNMKLVIMSAEPLDKLKAWTKKYFSDVPNFNAHKPKYDDFYFSKDDDKRVHFVKTIDDSEELSVLFNVEDDTAYWKSKPVHVISRLLGDEGKGSLLSYLKKQGWGLGVTAGQSAWNTLGVTVNLTPEGRKHYQEVTSAIFGYIALIKKQGYPQYIFEDEKAMRQIDLDNLEPSASGNRAAWFAKSMTDYPVDEFLERNFLMKEYSKDDFQKFLNYLDLKNVHIIVQSKNEKTDSKEAIFGIEYHKEKISPEFFAKLEQPTNDMFVYPEKNKYVPTDFSLVTKNQLGSPEKIQLAEASVIYYQQDTELGIARSMIDVRFVSNVNNGPREYLLNHLFTVCKEEELKEWAAPIVEARVEYDLTTLYGDMMMFSVSGYSHRLMTTLKDLVVDKENNRRLDQCIISDALFGKIKDKIKKEIQNKEEDVAFQRLGEELNTLATDKGIPWKDYLPLIDKITLKDVQAFGKEFFSEASLVVRAYGNVKPEEIKTIPTFLKETLAFHELPKKTVDEKERLFRYPEGGKQYSLLVKGRNNNFAMTSVYKVAQWSVDNHAKILLLGQMIAQPYFSELRTTQQLGYVARSGPSFNRGFVGITASLQSPKYPSIELQERSHKFLMEFLKTKMASITDEEIKPIKSALVNELLNKPNTLGERFMQFRDAIATYHGHFAIRTDLADSLKKISAKDLKEFVQKSFFEDKPGILTAFYYGTGTKIPLKKLPGQVFEKSTEVKDWVYDDPYNLAPEKEKAGK